MENKRGNWLKLYRESLDSTVWQNPYTWKVWCWALMRANHSEVTLNINSKDLVLKPGQFMSSHDSAVKELGRYFSISRVRTALKYLKSTGRLTSQATANYSIFTILNWEDYQSIDKPLSKLSTNSTQASDKRATTDKKDQEGSKKEEEYKPPVLVVVEPVNRELAAEEEELEHHLEEPNGTNDWEKTNEFINLGKRPLKKYQEIFLTLYELKNTLEIYHEALPGENWRPAFLQCEAEIKKQIASGKKRMFISAYNYLTTFCLEAAMRRKNEKVKIDKNSERKNYAR